jgi:PhnB protein
LGGGVAAENRPLTDASPPPAGFPRIVPHLIYDDVDTAIDWLTTTFGFQERVSAHHVDPDGKTGRTQLEIADSLITVGRPSLHGRSPQEGVSSMLYVFVENLDAHWVRTQRSNAKVVAGPHSHAGHRRYQVTDPEGHQWTFAEEERPQPEPEPLPSR